MVIIYYFYSSLFKATMEDKNNIILKQRKEIQRLLGELNKFNQISNLNNINNLSNVNTVNNNVSSININNPYAANSIGTVNGVNVITSNNFNGIKVNNTEHI